MKKLLFLGVLLSLLMVACGDDDDPDPTLNVSKNEVTVESGATELTIDVTSNTGWSATSSATDWCTVTPSSGTNNGQITIKVTQNPDIKDRSTTVIVKSETIERTINVKQDPASRETVIVGNWVIDDQTSPEPAFDIVEGIVFELKESKDAIVIIERQLTPELPVIETLNGTWAMSGDNVTFTSELLGFPFTITLEITQFGADTFACSMKTNMPGLLPADGLPVVISRQE